MTDQLLNLLKLGLLVLLYLFFARVLYAVWSEVKAPRTGDARSGDGRAGAPVAMGPPQNPSPAPGGATTKPKRGTPTQLVVIAPKAVRGTAYGIGHELVMGRSPGCAISMPDDTFVSQLHARVFPVDGLVWVEDMGSTNGTFVNGNRLTQAVQLHKGDRVQVGSTVLEART